MPSPDLRTEVLTRLGGHRDAWDHLVATQPLPTPFLRSWWVDHVAEDRLRVLACFAGDELVGGAAFEVDRVGRGPFGIERVRSVGQGVLAPDHLDLVAAEGHHAGVARAVLAWLRRRGSRVVDLDGLAATGTLAALLAPHEVGRVAAPFADLSVGAAQYLGARPGKVRSTIKRSAKRFAADGVEFVTVDREHIDAALDHLAELHDQRWAEGSVFLRGWERFCRAARAGALDGEVVVHELRDTDGRAVAVELDLVLGDTVAFYQAGRRTEREWRGCGSVLRARLIESAVAAGATRYDLLRGDEGYKAEWATDRRELVHCTMGVGPFGVAAVRARAARAALEQRRAARRDSGALDVDGVEGGAVSP